VYSASDYLMWSILFCGKEQISDEGPVH
jgi:hypothetical protein